MTLDVGARLGPYAILSTLGAGGMGEVYRARDTKLDREVAIKVLPAAFANDSDRLARFTREARTLAALNHPNIAQIHGLEESTDVRALVMELVDGQDLATVIARGPLSLTYTLGVARQIAEALEAAHELGIIHRDVKPGNVKVRDDGTVKVLDFGLARVVDAASEGRTTDGPTVTAHATKQGLILGTAAYMAPEQARGRAVDKRADIWAFGVVLYEMLTGDRPFKGADVAETLASVLKDRPSLDALPASTPGRLKRLIARCLEPDVKERLRDIGEARVEIARTQAGVPDITDALSSPASARSSVTRMLPWALAAIFGIALIVSLLVRPEPSFEARSPRKLMASAGAAVPLPTGTGPSAVLSPDGTTLVFVGRETDTTRLFVRRLDQLDAVVLAGTEGALHPFFKADGRWIGFFAANQLKKVSLTGGAVVTLCDAPDNRGGTWSEDGTIVFTGRPDTLMRVSEDGGTPVRFGETTPGAFRRWPQALPGGKGIVYTDRAQIPGSARVMIAPLSGGSPKVAVPDGYFGRYVADTSAAALRAGRERGYLVYMRQGTLFAVPFDLDRLEATGQAAPVIDDVSTNVILDSAQLSFSSEGTLVYVSGDADTSLNPIDWMSADGKPSPLRAAKSAWSNPRFSPDGRKLAFQVSNAGQSDIWVYEFGRDAMTQVTFDPSQDVVPVWTPDGTRLAFSSDRAKPGIFNMYWVNADGTGDVTRLFESQETQVASSWHPSGEFLAFHQAGSNTSADLMNQVGSNTSADLMMLPMRRDNNGRWAPGSAPRTFLALPGLQISPMFSPDGRWIAYTSAERGRLDVMVRPFHGSGGPWMMTPAGGIFPRWSATASELLFQDSLERKVMSVAYTVVGDSLLAAAPRVWAPTNYVRGFGLNSVMYDLHPDGRRVAFAAAREQRVTLPDQVVFLLNFADRLREIAPTPE
jgi:serine/threonine-protein kinase